MSIKFCSLSSGSSGNCHFIGTDRTKILVDAGFSGVQIERLLVSVNIDINTIDYILVTHEHLDHVKGAGVLSRRYDIPILANEKTWLGMEKTIGCIKEENIKTFKTNVDFNLDDLSIHPFRIHHDAKEPVGYIVYYRNCQISIATDTGWIDNSIKEKIKGSDLYLVEANHDVDMLKEGSYPYFLKQRVLSNEGHLSNLAAGEVLAETLLGKGEIVVLGHLSRENNTPDLAYETVRGVIGRAYDYINLDLSYRDRPTKIYTLF